MQYCGSVRPDGEFSCPVSLGYVVSRVRNGRKHVAWGWEEGGGIGCGLEGWV